MNRDITVTILMPVYNGAAYLNEAIDSILAQTYSNFNLLIINDGSKDNTQAIIDSYSDSRIISVEQENMGVSRSLNKGLSMINTPYVRRHDADDISETWMLEWQVNFLETHKDVAAVSTRCNFMTENSKISESHLQPKDHIFEGKELIYAQREHFEPFCPIVHGSVLCRTEIFEEFGGYRTEFLTSEDNDLWLRIIEKYKFAILNKSPYKLRLNPGSATQMHKSSGTFFRNLALLYADERMVKGSDPFQRGEALTDIKYEIITEDLSKLAENGKLFAGNYLNFLYKVAISSKDYKLAFFLIKESLKVGWKLSNTWRAIFFPILGDKFVKTGMSIKKMFK
ncbi:glycosyltransferase family A protein [Formosa undariae]|uniref:Glycosyltransferase family A protein n=1 Tax=Formosa undariae TaxID=1325436 RepID=A0ABV5F506_9FLAO